MTNVMSNNPFRTPQLSPQNTNTSINLRAGGGDTPISSEIIQNNLLFDSIPDEAPPPYTLSADTLEEETPINLGPSSRRPFQEPLLPDLPPRTQIAQPSIRINDNQLEPSSEVRNLQQPPPRHPTTISTTTNTNRRSASVSSPTSPVSPIRSRSDRLSLSYFPPPPGPPPGGFSSESEGRSQSQTYDPPSGPPPRRAVSSAASSSNRLSDNSNNNISRPIDDGRPTTTPVPGHPLLLQNKLLVYPSGFECSQCKNVGYKNNDPSHPCTKCWSKYARSYSGALAYAPFPSASTNGGSSSSNFQRPLPNLRPPHGSSASSSSSSRPATQKPPQQGQARLRRRSQSESKLNGGNIKTSPSMSSLSPSPRINANTSPRTSVPQSPVTQRPVIHANRIPSQPSQSRTPAPQSAPSQRPVLTNRQSCISTRPPLTPQSPSSPGGGRPIIYQAGDPRLGGRLCWRCDGRGRISYFLLDSTTCEICGGIGRTFN